MKKASEIIVDSKLTQTTCLLDLPLSCSHCRLSDLCLPIALNQAEIERLDDIIQRNRPLKKGAHLYRQGDIFKSIFAVRSGSFKSYVLGLNGQRHVTGFFFPGDIIGIDAIARHHHLNSTVALEHASVCEIPFSQLEKLSHQLPGLQHQFFSIMGTEISKAVQIHTLLSSYTAEQRLASFILSLSTRFARCQLSSKRFLIHMTRGDIGEYLGLTLESVSRSLSVLKKKQLISISSKDIEIKDIEGLQILLADKESPR